MKTWYLTYSVCLSLPSHIFLAENLLKENDCEVTMWLCSPCYSLGSKLLQASFSHHPNRMCLPELLTELVLRALSVRCFLLGTQSENLTSRVEHDPYLPPSAVAHRDISRRKTKGQRHRHWKARALAS